MSSAAFDVLRKVTTATITLDLLDPQDTVRSHATTTCALPHATTTCAITLPPATPEFRDAMARAGFAPYARPIVKPVAGSVRVAPHTYGASPSDHTPT